jgi:membrane associated rhomboid family serine protease
MEINFKSVTVILIALNLISSLIGFNSRDFMSKAIMWPYGVKRNKEYFRFISSGFLHADFVHLFFNMFTLYFFGTALEKIFEIYNLGGIYAYLALYISGLVVSDLPSYFKHKDDRDYHSLGASGAVSAVVFAVILFNPWESIYLYGAFKISALVYAILYVAYCIYMGKQGNDNINHDAHLWGSIFGFAFALVLVIALQPDLLKIIIEDFKHPSLFGR